jgi:hypothetical protein
MDKILQGEKTIEVRGKGTEHRGVTWVSPSGSRFIAGSFDLVACEGPLSKAEWEELRPYHRVQGPRLYGESTYAWMLSNATRARYCVPCARTTQVTWVRYAAASNACWRVH